MSQGSKIRINALCKYFEIRGGVFTALDHVSVDVASGEFFCIVGPSGCGKTTLLRILAGLETKSSGDFFVDHMDKRRPQNALVFQEQSIFPWMTVEDNVGFGLVTRGVDTKRRREIVHHYVEKVGLTKFARAYPHQLSGGMKQRVSIARAFATDPEILLMDEPFAALDEQTKLLLQEELLRIWEESKKTVVYITHSIDEALTLGDRIVVMTSSPGRIKAEFALTFPRPRRVLELRAKPEYGEMMYKVWQVLREEVLRAKAAEVGQ